MKKLFTLIAAIFAFGFTAHADLLLQESFNYPVGNLDNGTVITGNANLTEWYLSRSTIYGDVVPVVEGNLSYEGYATGTGSMVKISTVSRGNYAQRAFLATNNTLNSGNIYAAFLLRVNQLHAEDNKEGYVFSFANTGGNYGPRLYIKTVGEQFQLGIMKSNTGSYSNPKETATYGEALYNTNETYLVVVECEIVEGDKNDIARLYVNPTATEKTPVVTKTHELVDVAVSSVTLLNSSNAPGEVYIDELKVATAWADLFESSGEPEPEPETPAISTTPVTALPSQVYIGETYTATYTIHAANLTGDITLTSDNEEVTFAPATIAKADAESEAGAQVTLTLVSATSSLVNYDYVKANITLAAEGAENATIALSWWAVPLTQCATLAQVRTAEDNIDPWDGTYIKFNGEAVVTYAVTETLLGSEYNLLYLQDATGAIRISNPELRLGELQAGDKITGFIVTGNDPEATVPLAAAPGSTATVLSQYNVVTPMLITLEDLRSNAEDLWYSLVRVEDVTFATTTPLASGDQISQDGNNATINLPNGEAHPLYGATKPARASVIGISNSKAGTVLRLRELTDLLEYVSTSVENVELTGEAEIYTVSGVRVAELQPGVNIVREGNKTYKVVR